MKAQLQITGERYKVICILCYCNTCVFLCAHCNVALTVCYTLNRSVMMFVIFCQFCPLSFGTIRRIGLDPVLMLRCVWTASPRRRRNAQTLTVPNGNSLSLCKNQIHHCYRTPPGSIAVIFTFSLDSTNMLF